MAYICDYGEFQGTWNVYILLLMFQPHCSITQIFIVKILSQQFDDEQILGS